MSTVAALDAPPPLRTILIRFKKPEKFSLGTFLLWGP
jgi:hypothetical protein